MKGKRILIVDDDSAIADFVRTVVELEGGIVVLAVTGAHALECFRTKGLFDLIVLDLALPDISGWELLTAAREFMDGCKVIIFSARQSDQSTSSMPRQVVDLRLIKPAGAATLRDALMKVLGPPESAPPSLPVR